MRAEVDQNLCIGCGMCTGMCPTVFQMNGEGKAEGYAEGDDAQVQDVIASCPVVAITEV